MMSMRCCASWIVFFFKQKTAYEMRISDWSSDVCSSDLRARHPHHGERHPAARRQLPFRGARSAAELWAVHDCARRADRSPDARPARRGAGGQRRSEEHTSELQSLMRISYAVFCLKNTTNTTNKQQQEPL